MSDDRLKMGYSLERANILRAALSKDFVGTVALSRIATPFPDNLTQPTEPVFVVVVDTKAPGQKPGAFIFGSMRA